jgi:hypothetical protein
MSILDRLLTGDNLQKIVLALVAILGGGNLVATNQTASTTQHEIEQALKEVHELHSEFHNTLDSIIERQKRLEDALTKR